jgi:hypothetical protein
MTHDLSPAPGESWHEAARRLVVAGAENAPVRVWVWGRHVASHGSLYRMAATTIREEPSVATTRWRPHPLAQVSQRLLDVIEAEHAAMDAARTGAGRARKASHGAGATQGAARGQTALSAPEIARAGVSL